MLRMVCFAMSSEFRADDFGVHSLPFRGAEGMHLSLYISSRPRIHARVLSVADTISSGGKFEDVFL